MNSNLKFLQIFLSQNLIFSFSFTLLMLGSFIYGIMSTLILKGEECIDKKWDYVVSSLLLLSLSFGYVFTILSVCPLF